MKKITIIIKKFICLSLCIFMCVTQINVTYLKANESTTDVYDTETSNNKSIDNGELKSQTKNKIQIKVSSDFVMEENTLIKYIGNDQEIVIPEGVTEIGAGAFANCKNLRRVDFPSTLKRIGNSAFYDCITMSEVEFPASLESISYNAFRNCTSLKEIKIPKGIKETGQSFHDGPFAGCSNLSSVEFESGIEVIPSDIFNNVPGLEEIVIPEGVTEIGAGAFSSCKNLRRVDFPSTLKRIGNSAFYDCITMSEVEFPASLESISYNAFRNCTSLKEIKIPKGIKETGQSFHDGPFAGCSNLSSVEFESGIEVIPSDIFNNVPGLEEIVIPEGVTEIGAGAFSSCENLKSVELPTTLKKIDNDAFNNCNSLSHLLIPNSVTYIGRNAIPENTVISCNKYSQTMIYCIKNGIDTNYYQNDEITLSMVDIDKSYFLSTLSSDVNSGYLSLMINYNLKDGVSHNDKKLEIYFPDNVNVLEETLYLDSNLLIDYEYDDVKNILRIPLKKTKGILKFSVKLDSYEENLKAYALITDKNNKSELIDVLDEQTNSYLSLEVPSITGSKSIEVSGITQPNEEIEILVDGKSIKKVISNKVGKYIANIELATSGDKKIFEVCVRNKKGTEISKNVQYIKSAPKVNKFVMYYNNHSDTSIDLLGLNGKKPFISYNPNVPLKFKIKLDNNELVNEVFVVSTKNNVRKYLKTKYNKETAEYEAEGYFDGDKNYVPGTLTVEFSEKREKKVYEDEVDFSDPFYVNKVNPIIINSDITGKIDEASNKQVDLTLRDENKTKVSVSLKNKTNKYTEKELIDRGYEIVEVKTPLSANGKRAYGGRYAITVLESSIDECICEIIDLTTNEMTICGFNVSGGDVYSLFGSMIDYDSQLKQRMELEELSRQIDYSSLSYEEKKEVRYNLDLARKMNNAQFCITTVGVILTISGLSTFGMGIMLGVYAQMYSDTYELSIARMNGLLHNTGNSVNCLWCIDPSGVVYDSTTNEPLSGVKTTIFYKDPKTGKEMLWNAEEYSQFNPIITGSDGAYAWDVPEGLWRVKCEKTGYKAAYSEWLEVPPPRTKVNIYMERIEIENINIVQKEVLLKKNETIILELEILPSNAYKDLKWTSSNPKVASVNENGKVVAHESGESTITVTTSKGKTSKCKVYVDTKEFNFTDVPKDKWYYNTIKEAYNLGLVSGTTETTFSPNAPMNRGMVATVLHRMAGSPAVSYSEIFPDVAKGKYYSNAVTWAAKEKIISGYKDGRFGPGDNITRQDMAVILYNYASKNGGDMSKVKDLETFKDGKTVSSYAQKAMKWAVGNGIISGTSDGKLNPKASATRAECTKMLLQTYKFVY